MPRATPVPDNEETLTAPKRVRRAPRKKVVASEEEPGTASAPEPTSAVAPVRRKAPTRRVAAPAAAPQNVQDMTMATSAPSVSRVRRGGRMQVLVIVGALIIGVGASAAIGLSDSGKIDVAARIQEQSQLMANQTGGNDQGGVQTVPVQNTPVNVPNGGLVPAGAATPPPPPPEPATTTTATTSDEVASSTEAAVVDEVSTDPATESMEADADNTASEPTFVE